MDGSSGEPVKRRRREKRQGRRPKTYSPRQIREAVELELDPEPENESSEERPRTRGECRGGARPCPWVGCRFHLYLSVNTETGTICIHFPDLEPWELAETCALDIADRGGATLEEVGQLTNLTRERIRQIEVRSMLNLRTTRTIRALR